MTIGIRVGNITDEIGSSDFFHAFFSTISANLEPQGWGTRFPVLMTQLYHGRLVRDQADPALAELEKVFCELTTLPPGKVVWDIENLHLQPPWEDRIAKEITSLGNYFVTSVGRDLITVLREALEDLKNQEGDLEVVSI